MNIDDMNMERNYIIVDADEPRLYAESANCLDRVLETIESLKSKPTRSVVFLVLDADNMFHINAAGDVIDMLDLFRQTMNLWEGSQQID